MTLLAGNGFGVVTMTNVQALINGRAKVINNKYPFGGSATTCIWTNRTNCGPNDEVFSFHGPVSNLAQSVSEGSNKPVADTLG